MLAIEGLRVRGDIQTTFNERARSLMAALFYEFSEFAVAFAFVVEDVDGAAV